jgi:hypothetical protein
MFSYYLLEKSPEIPGVFGGFPEIPGGYGRYPEIPGGFGTFPEIPATNRRGFRRPLRRRIKKGAKTHTRVMVWYGMVPYHHTMVWYHTSNQAYHHYSVCPTPRQVSGVVASLTLVDDRRRTLFFSSCLLPNKERVVVVFVQYDLLSVELLPFLGLLSLLLTCQEKATF